MPAHAPPTALRSLGYVDAQFLLRPCGPSVEPGTVAGMNAEPFTLPPLVGAALDNFAACANSTGADADVVDAAVAQVARRRPLLIGVSGWPGAGKDVIGEGVCERFGVDATHVYFAVPLKREVDDIITACRTAGDRDAAVAAVAAQQDVDTNDARMAIEVIYDEAQDPEVHARTRSTAVRTLLQRWGTDVRRRDNPDYWVQQALRPAISAIADGRSVYVTDVRFPNEVDGSRALGFVVVRLDISEDTVKARLAARDGLHLDDAGLAAMLDFPSESSLNDYANFDLRFANEGSIDDGLDMVEKHLRSLV